MALIIYNKLTNKIRAVVDTLDPKEAQGLLKDNEELFFNKNIKDFNQTDIRVYNKDGSVKSIPEQIKKGIIVLEENQIYDEKDNIVREITNTEEDRVLLYELGKKVDKTKKIGLTPDGRKILTDKTLEELLKDKVISQEEYNKRYNDQVIMLRQYEYTQNLDGARAELLEEVLVNLSEKGLLTDEELSKLEALNIKRKEIKEKYKKV